MGELRWLVAHHHIDLQDESPHLLARTKYGYLPALFRKMQFAMGAEIGVEEGRYGKRLLQLVPGLKLYEVDPWLSYGYYAEATKYDQATMDDRRRRAEKRLAPLNCEILAMTSEEAAGRFEDGSLDFVFIDGNHDFEHAYQDIGLWSPKVRSGGIVSGDDYFNSTVPGRCRVKDAVDAWTTEEMIAPWFVIVGGRRPCWFWVKA